MLELLANYAAISWVEAEFADPVSVLAVGGCLGAAFGFPRKAYNQLRASHHSGDGKSEFARGLAVARAERSPPSAVFILEMGGDLTDERVEHLRSELLSQVGDDRLTFFKVH
jgi:hypothetical protein